MSAVDALQRQIERDGFCVVEGVIPAGEVQAINAELLAALESNREPSEGELAKTRSRGHRIGTPGVAVLKQAINEVQSFAPYLADRRVLDIVEAFFGAWARISCTDCVANMPGNARGYWHADWPYNQTNASHIPAPYPDAVLHLSTIWMLTPFSAETGGTLVVPGSHRWPRNPAAGDMPEVDNEAVYPTERHVEGPAGSALVYDSRLWHAVAANRSDQPRVALIVRYAPWWLNLDVFMPGSEERKMIVEEPGIFGSSYPAVSREAYESLADEAKPLFRHWLGAR